MRSAAVMEKNVRDGPLSGINSNKCRGPTRCTSRASSTTQARSAMDDAVGGSNQDRTEADDESRRRDTGERYSRRATTNEVKSRRRSSRPCWRRRRRAEMKTRTKLKLTRLARQTHRKLAITKYRKRRRQSAIANQCAANAATKEGGKIDDAVIL